MKLPFTIRISNIDTWFSLSRRLTEIRHVVVASSPIACPFPPSSLIFFIILG